MIQKMIRFGQRGSRRHAETHPIVGNNKVRTEGRRQYALWKYLRELPALDGSYPDISIALFSHFRLNQVGDDIEQLGQLLDGRRLVIDFQKEIRSRPCSAVGLVGIIDVPVAERRENVVADAHAQSRFRLADGFRDSHPDSGAEHTEKHHDLGIRSGQIEHAYLECQHVPRYQRQNIGGEGPR